MKILVYDVAAESGGALSVLKNVYNYAIQHKEIEWKFVLSKIKLDNTANVQVENYPIVKKNWLARLIFDRITAPQIVKKYDPDIVLNLQNIAINSKVHQVLYMHQSLPFADYKFSIKHGKMWIYQNIIGKMIKKSCKVVDEIIVQTQWIKNAIIRQCHVNENKVIVKSPTIDKSLLPNYCGNINNNIYVYPANGSPYKNHQLIVQACGKLKREGYENYKIIFTLVGDETSAINDLYHKTKKENLNIEWIGYVSQENLYAMYADCGLIFPSYIETFGLPLLEARTANAPILASDTPFSKEICNGYAKVNFFDYTNADQLAQLIKDFKVE